MHKKTLVAAAIALVAGLGGGYYASHGAAAPQGPALRGAFARGGAAGAGGFLAGTVAKEDSESITVDTRDGSSRIVLITPDTSVSKSVNGTMSDVAVGANVIVSGSTNSDGSVSASLIQLRSALAGRNAPMTSAVQ